MTSLPDAAPLVPTLINYTYQGKQAEAVLVRPEGEGPFPTVVYNHGMVVDLHGYEGARDYGYNLDGILLALAESGFLSFAPIRKSGLGNLLGHKLEAVQAIDYVKTTTDVSPSQIALMGFSRGGSLTLHIGVERNDSKAILILAPAPGKGYFANIVQRVSSLNSPVLLMVEASDSPEILKDYEMLEQALREQEKEYTAIRYDRGGGHKLFWDVNYWWDDARAFLEKMLVT